MAAPSGAHRALRVVGVPEHFNRPFTHVCERPRAGASTRVVFTPVPGGTGAMMHAIMSGEADVAVALTEGILAAATSSAHASAGGAPVAYAGEYVTSSLRWMVATGAERADVSSLASLREQRDRPIRVSVSRLGSGSHLMAHVLANTQGWDPNNLVFLVHKDFRSMRRAVTSGEADIFMWEWFMTSEFVRSGELKTIGHCDTPWHCFGLAARRDWLAHPGNRELLRDVMQDVFAECERFTDPKREDAVCEDLAAHFGLSLADAHAWIAGVQYAQRLQTPLHMLSHVLRVLSALSIVSRPADAWVRAGDTDYDAWAAALCDLHVAPAMSESEEERAKAVALERKRSRRAMSMGDMSAVLHAAAPGAAAKAHGAVGKDIFTPQRPMVKEVASIGGAHVASRLMRRPSGDDLQAEPAAQVDGPPPTPVWHIQSRDAAPTEANHSDAAARRAAALAAIVTHVQTYGGAQVLSTQGAAAPHIPAAEVPHVLRGAVAARAAAQSGASAGPAGGERASSERTKAGDAAVARPVKELLPLGGPSPNAEDVNAGDAVPSSSMSVSSSTTGGSSVFLGAVPSAASRRTSSPSHAGTTGGRPTWSFAASYAQAPGSAWDGAMYDLG